MTPKRLREIRKKHKLTNLDIARLVRVPIQPAVQGARGEISRTVADWLSADKPTPIPDNVAELLEAKIWILEHSNTSLATLVEHELSYVLALLRTKSTAPKPKSTN